ncbi:2'-5' RNA ligase family protein [Actinotalea sp.]|uniref:2'-5' RNA ligase family protein n=1 Tax=Actinotalea sp. TaxID=1872145 RepID=UPI002C35E042|nr:2'-5' RNA ligase family protein [Actinotalea sp.]HQY33089.1 2'-5' RNA ligase family protein [Actinotalea sp.]HRA50998.1 2'-5' RNA ligase family protein [Actinotalea sp.]
MRLPDRVGDQVRIGVALSVPEPYGTVLQTARQHAGDPFAESIPPHVTLLGPTVLEPDHVDHVVTHLTAVAAGHRPFTLHLRGTGTFRPVSSVVFVQVVEGIAECEMLERDIRTGPLAQPLRFNYHPHVTVAHDVPEDSLDWAFDTLAGFEARFLVPSLQIFEHGDDGVWRVARDVPFSAA